MAQPIFFCSRHSTIRSQMPASRRSLPACRSSPRARTASAKSSKTASTAPSSRIRMKCCTFASRLNFWADPPNARHRATGDPRARAVIRHLARTSSGRSRCSHQARERRRVVRENPEDLIEPRDFENRPHRFLQTGERKLPAVAADVLHRLDQDRETGAVDVGDFREIDHELLRLLLDQRRKLGGDLRRNMEIDFAFERKNVGREVAS